MTFHEFQATKFHCADIGAAIGADMGVTDPVSGNMYVGCLYIEERQPWWPDEAKGNWHLVIDRNTRISDDLESLERELYEFATTAGYGDVTEATLCDELTAFCVGNNLPHMSADDLADEECVNAEQRAWLRAFGSRWDALMEGVKNG